MLNNEGKKKKKKKRKKKKKKSSWLKENLADSVYQQLTQKTELEVKKCVATGCLSWDMRRCKSCVKTPDLTCSST